MGAQGLLTSGRRLGQGERGYFAKTNNALIRHDGVIEPRFGLEALGVVASNITRILYDTKNAQVLRASTTNNVLQKWTGSAWSDLDTTRKYSANVAARNFTFLMSNEGLRRINSGNTATEIAFVPEGLDIELRSLSGSAGWMPDNTQVGYKVVFGVKNVADEFFLGAPSGRAIAINTAGGTRDTEIRFTVPSGLTTSYFYQVYRTRPSGGPLIDPGDEMSLIFEDYLTGTDISNGYVTFTDRVPNGNGGAALYTNESQQTDAQANYPCEAAMSSIGRGDLAFFANCLWANNYQPRSFLDLSLLAVLTETGLNARTFTADTNTSVTITNASSTAGLAIGQRIEGTGIPAGTTITNIVGTTITISAPATATAAGVSMTAGDIVVLAGTSYVAWTSEDIATNKFLVSTDASAAKAVRVTAESFIRVVNRSASNTVVYARYMSGPNQLPGQMRITARTDRASAYTVQCAAHGMAFFPNITTAQTILSKGEPGALVYSKPNEPQAWPPLNYELLPGNATVLALSALRTALLVWTDKGLYRITGVYGNFYGEEIDSSVILSSTSTNPGLGVVVVDNVAFAMTSKGLVAATESGAVSVSGNVSTYTDNTDITTGRLSAHYGDGLVFVPVSVGTLVFNTHNSTWTSWSTVYSTGVYDQSTRRMVLQDGTTTRRARDATYQAENLYDSDAAVAVNSISGNVVTLASAPVGMVRGDLLIQGVVTQVIESFQGAALTVANGAAFSAGAATVRIGYTVSATYCPMGSPSPTISKHVNYAHVVFDGATLAGASLATFNNTGYKKVVAVTFITDLDTTERSAIEIVNSNNFPFEARFWVPPESQRCSMMTVSFSFRCCANATRVLGIELDYEGISDKTRR